MLRRTGNPANRSAWLIVLTLCLAGLTIALPSGCSGGETVQVGPTPVPTATPVPTPVPTKFRATIQWGRRSRADGLSSALSARITLVGSDFSGSASSPQDVTMVANRPLTTTEPVSQTVESTVAVRPGSYLYKVQFYSQPDAEGTPVGLGQAYATVASDGALTTTIATVGAIRKVTVLTGQTIGVGERKDVGFTCTDASNNVVPIVLVGAGAGVTYGSARVQVEAGSDANLRVESDSSVTGLRPTQAMVRVVVDGVVSDPAAIGVVSNAAVAVTPSHVDPLGWENAVTLTAAVSNLPAGVGGADAGVTWKIENDPRDGTFGTITTGGVYTAPKLVSGQTRTVNVIATSVYDPTKTASVPITVRSVVAVQVTPNASPDPVRVSIKGNIAFAASVTNGSLTPAQDVTWTIVGPNGEDNAGNRYGRIGRDGAYTAPATAPAPDGFCKVVATSGYDSHATTAVLVQIVSGSIPVTVN